MASHKHEILGELFKEEPDAILGLAKNHGIELPQHGVVTVTDASQTVFAPASYRADLVVRIVDADDVVASYVHEVQLGIDKDKLYTWPIYWASEGLKHGAPTKVLVVTICKSVTSWARDLFAPIGGFSPVLVLGPEDIPVIDSPEAAQKSLVIAILSLVAHYDGDVNAPIVRVTVDEVRRVIQANKRLGGLCYDFLMLAMDSHIKELTMQNVDDDSPLSEKPLVKVLIELGEARGEAKGVADTLLLMLATRFGPVAEQTANRLFEASVAQLKRGAQAIFQAKSPDDVLEAVWAS